MSDNNINPKEDKNNIDNNSSISNANDIKDENINKKMDDNVKILVDFLTLNPMIIIYFVLSVLFAYFGLEQISGGFFKNFFAFIFGTCGAFVGALIGDFVRKLVIPDVIWTRGGFWDIAKTKIFWFIGPQIVGLLLGCAIIMTFFKKM